MRILDLKVMVSNQKTIQKTSSDERGQGQVWDIVSLRILTDEGIEGVSFAWGGRNGKITADYMHEIVRPALINEDPLNIEHIWYKLKTIDRWHGLFPSHIIGAIDVALWDILGKKSKLPVYKLLGSYREKVPAYASSLVLSSKEEYVEEALRVKEQGYHGYKLHPIGDPILDIETCKEVRKAVGNDFALMLDPVGIYNYQQALQVGRALEELEFEWFEEPIPDEEIDNLIRLSDKLDIPIAACESLSGSVVTSAQYVHRKAADIIRSDVSWKEGITGLRKTAILCEAFGLNCEIHTAMYALPDAANLHVNCSIKNGTYHEVLLPEEQFNFGVLNPIMIDQNGYVSPPSKPGIGIEVDWELLERTRIYVP